MRRLDHAAILLLIAGTYTPFCLVLGGKTGNALLVLIWVGAALGLLRAILWARAPRPIVAAIYVLLGWVVVPVMPSLLAVLGTPAVALLGAGGLVYTLGAVVYATKRPDPIPRILGYHEVFHAMVIAAAALHFAVAAMAIRALG
jgi:hemolysin III